jgi:hypothetical protein
LKDAFGQDLKCEDPSQSFTKLPILSERFSMSSSSEYFSYLPDLSSLQKFIRDRVCPPSSTACKQATTALSSASYIDIDYDAISHALNLNVFWDEASNAESWTESFSLKSQGERIEVGVLNHEKNPDPEDIGFSGFLTVLGQDAKPSTSVSYRSTKTLLHSPMSSSRTS